MSGAQELQDWVLEAHAADIIVCGFGTDVAQAFANAARAMVAAMTPLERIAARETVRVSCQAPDLDMLFYDWLNAVIYEMATRGMLFGDFRVRVEGDGLVADLLGEPVDPARHAPAVEPKGATLSELSVRRRRDGRWAARCVVDV
ncbi:archease [Acidimangrovimonas pyrenivorans]|uniref:Archease n=1 Tax=Acidimangrovimonas pyrenivorans TaxID=2030798 RepID=A0ABV7AFT1_9RHOB